MSTPEDNQLSSKHWVHFTDSQQREVYVLSGTCVLNPVLIGPQNGSEWQRGQTSFAIPLYDLPADKGLVIQQWAPTVVLGSIQDDPVAKETGWAVDDFDLSVTEGAAVKSVDAVFNYAVSDTNGQLRRVAYTVTVVGYYAQIPIIQ
jgi:hypothetical protein